MRLRLALASVSVASVVAAASLVFGCRSRAAVPENGVPLAMPAGFEHARYASLGPTAALEPTTGCSFWLGVDELVLAKADLPLMHLPALVSEQATASDLARPQLRAELVKSCADDPALPLHVDGRVAMRGLAELAYVFSLEKKTPLMVIDVPGTGLRALHPSLGKGTNEQDVALLVATSPGDESMVKSKDGRTCPAGSLGELTVCTQRLTEGTPKDAKIACTFLAVTPEATSFQHMLDVAYAIRADSGGGACTSTGLQVSL